MSQEPKPWGKLTSFTAQLDNISLVKDHYVVGRNSTNDIQIADIRLSGVHCKVYKGNEDDCWIEDLSSNGTFIEDDKIGKGSKRKLVSGDKIYLLHKSKVKNDEVLGYVFSSLVEDSSKLKRQREEDAKKLEEEKKQTEKQLKFQEDLGEEMRCCICIDYIYQCVTLIPCLHNFCSACFSDWMQKSKMCPQCREQVSEVKKNATVNNIIGKFMDNNPDKRRPKEEYDEMDQKNKIKEDRLILKSPQATPVATGGGGLFGQSVGSQLFGSNRNSTAAPARGGRGRRGY